MSSSAGSTTEVHESRRPRVSSRIGTGVCAVVLALTASVTGYVVLTAFMVEPDGPWDRQAITNSHVAAVVSLAFCSVMALLTWVFVRAEWLGRWWYTVPVVLAIAALLRLTLLAPSR
ncbi:hypothetical protein [Streptomyces echinatus]|uniref:Cadmium resistance protein CadD (Predicted permease) n=1 Tax=Streptomyces echinatus TaxID=67293 RepID=A0A7W9PRK7_9ACTN|nr:hypothetical protein [Streptomyces echinatus]MBB5926496.1 cadmium resistance protein CadD (predicted permease) [Streptomyces echinatus]